MRLMADSELEPKSGFPIWKACRWVVLCVMAIVLFLMLKKPPSVADNMAPEAAKQQSAEVQTKLADLEMAHQRGETAEARFSSDEINGVLQQAQTEPTSAPAAAQQQQVSAPQQQPEVAAEPAPEISTTRVAFEGDHATGQFVVHAPGGKEIYLTISGKLKAVDGYASFEFTEGKIGEMPVPVALLNSRLQAKL
jgi:hypothetical protein